MKILHVIPSISRVHGGPSVALQTMARALASAGVEVDVATTDDDGFGNLKIPLGEPIAREKVTYWFFRRQTRFYKFSLPLTQWLARNTTRYDAVHIHALFSYPSVPAAYFASQRGVPYIVRPLGTLNSYGMTQHHPAFKSVSYALLERWMISEAAFLHYTSELECNQARELGITAPSVVIPHGIDVAEFDGDADRTWLETYSPQLRGRINFLFLSRLDPVKGVEHLLDAFARLKSASLGLIVAGEGDAAYVETLHARARALQLNNSVVWAGFVAGDAKLALLRAADVFVLPSSSENFGIAVAEAMAAGLPVIVTPTVGVANEIEKYNAGLVVPSNSESIANAMDLVARDERRREIGTRGKKLAYEKFSTQAMTRALLNMYETALRETRVASKPQEASSG